MYGVLLEIERYQKLRFSGMGFREPVLPIGAFKLELPHTRREFIESHSLSPTNALPYSGSGARVAGEHWETRLLDADIRRLVCWYKGCQGRSRI